MARPGIFEPTLFSRRVILPVSVYIRAMHPKTAIRPDVAAIKRVLDAGWCGQLKIHGHRAQFHIPPDQSLPLLAYNRQALQHKKEIPAALGAELRRLFASPNGWTVVDAEWMKGDDRVYAFDLLRRDGQLLSHLTYRERWEMLPRVYASATVETLSLFKSVDKCLEALSRPDEWIEGLVFKALETPGFADTSIIRCRKRP